MRMLFAKHVKPKPSFRKQAGQFIWFGTKYIVAPTVAFQMILNLSAGTPMGSTILFGVPCVTGADLAGNRVGPLTKSLACIGSTLSWGVAALTEPFFDTPQLGGKAVSPHGAQPEPGSNSQSKPKSRAQEQWEFTHKI